MQVRTTCFKYLNRPKDVFSNLKNLCIVHLPVSANFKLVGRIGILMILKATLHRVTHTRHVCWENEIDCTQDREIVCVTWLIWKQFFYFVFCFCVFKQVVQAPALKLALKAGATAAGFFFLSFFFFFLFFSLLKIF